MWYQWEYLYCIHIVFYDLLAAWQSYRQKAPYYFFFYLNSILILRIFWFLVCDPITLCKYSTAFLFMRDVSASDQLKLQHYSCKYGPTELLQGWESVEVGFDGHLIGRWQVWEALEGAWERQVIWLRLWCQDAAYPIVFWRHIHTYIYRHREGKERKVDRLSFKRKSRIVMEHHLLRQTYLEDGGRPECKCHEYFSFGDKKKLKRLDYCNWGYSLDTPAFLRGGIIVYIKDVKWLNYYM